MVDISFILFQNLNIIKKVFQSALMLRYFQTNPYYKLSTTTCREAF